MFVRISVGECLNGSTAMVVYHLGFPALRQQFRGTKDTRKMCLLRNWARSLWHSLLFILLRMRFTAASTDDGLGMCPYSRWAQGIEYWASFGRRFFRANICSRRWSPFLLQQYDHKGDKSKRQKVESFQHAGWKILEDLAMKCRWLFSDWLVWCLASMHPKWASHQTGSLCLDIESK